MRITGLNKNQVEMLDMMWSFETQEELMLWMDTLTEKEVRQVQSLLELIRFELIEEQINKDGCFDAIVYLQKYKLYNDFH